MKILLETSRLTLHQFTDDDLDRLVTLDSDPEVMRYVNGGFPSSRAEISKTFLPDIFSYYAEFDRLGFWAIKEKSSNEFIGWVVLRPESRFRLAKILNAIEPNALELGYRLRKVSWGQGYATEASQALINKVLALGKYQKVIAWALAENKASIAVMKKLGFALEREYILTAADILPNVRLLENPVIKNVLGRKLVKYSTTF